MKNIILSSYASANDTENRMYVVSALREEEQVRVVRAAGDIAHRYSTILRSLGGDNVGRGFSSFDASSSGQLCQERVNKCYNCGSTDHVCQTPLKVKFEFHGAHGGRDGPGGRGDRLAGNSAMVSTSMSQGIGLL